ncbi:methyltransferase [Trinickia caryophylli]|uniref:Ubiquinone/menaquinone biosynthesis C-methylase UbiE n=1 Tax=Trinickia caryophylli TaxID=28094 RepID=A0A1X7GHK6_TRICW|nr:class I SAM-dependent methyltransferase [Trinickia caryophylli]PMS09851.1 methyltransferase domain-containing protein [Trinickia caryophylli]TRX14887.1 methyltransferase domain-containing protein [Trinickia caryophylli]WQE14735.1 methyltransferase domain-containing protein [Trinickia caryophylli]SMF70011.1 Ubiquinone/menaquinone biosynthesis C-methylase UbiE [Trinickia caryophylli]GLU34931.1 hypothetical protein Busp01_47730 [Trinickia caryophylli]
MDAIQSASVGVTAPIDPSYQLGRFRDNEDSLRRLNRQASIATELEFEYLSRAGLMPESRILDLGCGSGAVSAAIAERFSPRRLVAADVNDVSIQLARQRLQGLPNADVQQLNVYDPQVLPIGQFDFIYSRLVFQHLSEPVLALVNARHCLAPGGRLCICDIDDDWLKVVPAVPALDSFLSRVGRAQAERGGDRTVGSRLPGYMRTVGFTDIRSEILLLSTDLISKEAFFDLMFGYKREVIPAEQLAQADLELAGIREALESRTGWAGVAVYFVSGANPERSNS